MREGKQLVLCVDDDPDILDALETILTKGGYACVGAPSAEEGLKVYKKENPDLILADLMMEEVDAGTSFVKELQAAGNTAPVFLLSSIGDELSDAVNPADLGVAGVLQKPVDSDELLKIVGAKLRN